MHLLTRDTSKHLLTRDTVLGTSKQQQLFSEFFL